jgi:TolB-like protein
VPVTLVLVARSRTGERPSDAAITPMPAPASGIPPGAEGVTRIAVLPFVNLGSPDDEYFVAGMTEEITSRLAGLKRLAVSSSTTVTQYDRRGKGVRRIGADLGVAYVVEGSVRWEQASVGRQVRITPKLIRVADDTAVWTQQYDAALSDLFAVQADIAYRITGAMQVALEARERRMVEARATADTEAHLAYLRGITAYRQGASDTSNLAQARADLENAVARDPRFAVAWSWLARVYAAQYNSGAQRKPEIRQSAQHAARTAIELDPGLPEGHLGLAQMLFLEREYDRALRELEIARVGLPNSPELFRLIGSVEGAKGRWSESLSAYTRGFDLDPAPIAEAIAVHYLHLRQYTEWFDGRHQRALDLIEEMDSAGAWLPPDFRFPASVAAGEASRRARRGVATGDQRCGGRAALPVRARPDPRAARAARRRLRDPRSAVQRPRLLQRELGATRPRLRRAPESPDVPRIHRSLVLAEGRCSSAAPPTPTRCAAVNDLDAPAARRIVSPSI